MRREDSTSWEISHTIQFGDNIINNFRVGSLGATVIQGDSPAPQSDVDALRLSGVFTSLPDYARGYPTVSLQNLERYSGQSRQQSDNQRHSDVGVCRFDFHYSWTPHIQYGFRFPHMGAKARSLHQFPRQLYI